MKKSMLFLRELQTENWVLARYNEKEKKTMTILADSLFLIEFRY
jgi:hypothetical protein